jgi:Gas vesicle protein G
VGVIRELVLLPLAPLRFTVWVAGYVAEEVDRREFSQEAAVRKLRAIQVARERGELDQREADDLETQILQQQIARSDRPSQLAG